MVFLIFFGAALAEIAGCFSFWAWLKLKYSMVWLIPGTVFLWIFAYLLTWIEAAYAGKVYASYGAIYIVSSLMWMWGYEKNMPDVYDVIGALICLLGASIILWMPRAS